MVQLGYWHLQDSRLRVGIKKENGTMRGRFSIGVIFRSISLFYYRYLLVLESGPWHRFQHVEIGDGSASI
jgi:hypothetical protein